MVEFKHPMSSLLLFLLRMVIIHGYRSLTLGGISLRSLMKYAIATACTCNFFRLHRIPDRKAFVNSIARMVKRRKSSGPCVTSPVCRRQSVSHMSFSISPIALRILFSAALFFDKIRICSRSLKDDVHAFDVFTNPVSAHTRVPIAMNVPSFAADADIHSRLLSTVKLHVSSQRCIAFDARHKYSGSLMDGCRYVIHSALQV